MMRLVPRTVRRSPRRAGRELSRAAARDAALGRAAAPRARADDRAADARASSTPPITSIRFLADKLGVELVEGRDLFVARRHRLHAHHRRAAAGRCDLSADRRRFPRSARLPAGFGARRARADRAPIWPAMSRSPMRSAPASPTTRRSTPTCPRSSRFYLGEEPLLQNVPTWRCREPDALAYVLEHLDELVVKEVNGSGGYGMLVGPHATPSRSQLFAAKLTRRSRQLHRPADARALDLSRPRSTHGIAPRHVDFGRSSSPAPTGCASCRAASPASR